MMNKLVAGLFAAFALMIAAPGDARADATCTAPVTNAVNYLTAHPGWYDFELTIHRTDVDLVSYSRGRIEKNGSNAYWPLRGYQTNQLFSDRWSGYQPFNNNAADALTVYIGSTGQLYIYYNTWNFTTQWDLSCSGSTFTRLVPGVGVVTLTLRGWYTIG